MLVPHVTRKLRKLIKSLNEPASVVSYSLNIFPSLGLMVIQRTFSGTYFRGVEGSVLSFSPGGLVVNTYTLTQLTGVKRWVMKQLDERFQAPIL